MIKYKEYASEEEYFKHQAKKLDIQLGRKRKESKARLKRQLIVARTCKKYSNGGTILCFGARLGEEVIAFNEYGFKATGIDLNPGVNNRFVIKGDMHNTPFEDNSFDCGYCNCLDHSNDIEKFVKEAKRIIRDWMFLEVMDYAKIKPKEYEVAIWNHPDEPVKKFDGFKVVDNYDINKEYRLRFYALKRIV